MKIRIQNANAVKILLIVGILILALTLVYWMGLSQGAAKVQVRSSKPDADRSGLGKLSVRAHRGTVPASYYGVNARLAFSGDPSTWSMSAARISELGVGVVRRDASWAGVEPSPPRGGVHRYRWQRIDEMVSALAQHDLRWYPIVDYATTWAGVSGWESPPSASDVADYASFAGALARRYGRRGSFWHEHPELPEMPIGDYEIWNEPNVAHFWPDQSYAPARMAKMYLAAQAQIKRADPSAHVVVGGLAVAGAEGFLARMVRAQPRLRKRLEAVGFHPYGGGPNGGLQITYAEIRSLRSSLSKLVTAYSVPIEVTETGWAVPPTPEAWRSQRLQRLAVELPLSTCNVTRFIAFSWTSEESESSIEDGYGIVRADGTPTESELALREGISMMRTATGPAAPVNIC
jgi:hypothetical protein